MHNDLLLTTEHEAMNTVHAVAIYLEDAGDGIIRISAQIIGQPDQSKELADEILEELVGCNGIQPAKDSIFTAVPPSGAFH
jgi:hypothetical protein